nr:hypothetical protein [Acanthopleuribacter pedis]
MGFAGFVILEGAGQYVLKTFYENGKSFLGEPGPLPALVGLKIIGLDHAHANYRHHGATRKEAQLLHHV